MDKIWAYRTIDASYRVHARVYKLHHTLYHTEKTIFTLLRNNIITSGAVLVSSVLGFTLFFVQIADIKLLSTPVFIMVGLILVLLFIYGYQYKQAKEVEKDLNMISKEIKGEPLEKWPDYLWDQAAEWATRIIMAKAVLDENEKTHLNKQEESYILNKKNFTHILENSINKLKTIKKECETCLESNQPEGKDIYTNTIQICKEFIETMEEK